VDVNSNRVFVGSGEDRDVEMARRGDRSTVNDDE
jgi:hypothetical protein